MTEATDGWIIHQDRPIQELAVRTVVVRKGLSRAAATMFDDFEALTIDTGEAAIFVRRAGSGRPVLLLHGFPETHLMWRDVAPLLARRFTVICADLRGYGQSSCPPSRADHAPYAKRALAEDMAQVMQRLGFDTFAVAGHDRGGRVAYRLALDHPGRISALAVLDIVPTMDAWERANAEFALAFWPWSLLAQAEPLPEQLISAAPEAVIDNALGAWGSPAPTFSAAIRHSYVEALRDPARVHAICEEYRAAASIDREHDRADRDALRRIRCPVLVLWSRSGGLDTWYSDIGGPIALWRRWADDVRGGALDAGHFFPEERPDQTAGELTAFLAA